MFSGVSHKFDKSPDIFVITKTNEKLKLKLTKNFL